MFKPRSPKESYNKAVGLPRMFDRMRANASGTLGEYKVGENSELDRQIRAFLQFDFDAVLPQVEAESTDEEIWNLLVQSTVDNGHVVKSESEIAEWSDSMLNMKLKEDPERVAYRDAVIAKMGLPDDITTFDWLVMSDDL